jgi:putative hydrolase of the HAD superfamily
VVVSGELGIAKPSGVIFAHALERLDVRAEHAAMIGDSLARDIDGAIAAGLFAFWVNRDRTPASTSRPGMIEISTLSELPHQLRGLVYR